MVVALWVKAEEGPGRDVTPGNRETAFFGFVGAGTKLAFFCAEWMGAGIDQVGADNGRCFVEVGTNRIDQVARDLEFFCVTALVDVTAFFALFQPDFGQVVPVFAGGWVLLFVEAFFCDLFEVGGYGAGDRAEVSAEMNQVREPVAQAFVVQLYFNRYAATRCFLASLEMAKINAALT